jgi:hypothetical protein
MRRRGPLRDKGQVEVVDDAVDHGIVGEESDDLHRAAALRADHRINFIDFTDHIGPAFGGDGPELFLHHPEKDRLLGPLEIAAQIDAAKARPAPPHTTEPEGGENAPPRGSQGLQDPEPESEEEA